MYIGQVGSRGIHAVLLDVGLKGADVGLGSGELSALRVDLGHDLLLIELGQFLAFMDTIIDVGIELLDDAGSLRFDLDFGDGLNLPGGHDGLGDIAPLHFGDAVGVDLRASDETRRHDAEHDHHQQAGGPDPDPDSFALFCNSHESLPALADG